MAVKVRLVLGRNVSFPYHVARVFVQYHGAQRMFLHSKSFSFISTGMLNVSIHKYTIFDVGLGAP